MAYKIKRKRIIKEELQLCDENGNKVDSIFIDFDVDSKYKAFNAARNEVIKIELAFKEAKTQELEELQVNYGDALIKMFEVLFGKENTEKIIAFYEERYVEMAEEILPFIHEVFLPELKKKNNANLEDLKKKYAKR